MSLDVLVHNEYITLWDEYQGATHEMGEALWIEYIDETAYIMGSLDQIWYTEKLQTAYDTLNATIPVTVRITRRDVLGEVIVALTTEFVLEVHGNGEISGCDDKLPTLKSSSGDWQVSFNADAIASGENDRQSIYISQTVEAKVEDEMVDCGIYFKLLVFDGTNWVTWGDLVETLKAENPDFSSSVEFDPETADFKADFTLNDYNTFKARFTNSGTGKVEMVYRPTPIVPGSSLAGPTAAVDTLTTYG
jgi:hypothetical protein